MELQVVQSLALDQVEVVGLEKYIRDILSNSCVYDKSPQNLTKCWAQLEAKVMPTSDDLLKLGILIKLLQFIISHF